MMDPETEGQISGNTKFKQEYHKVVALYMPEDLKNRQDTVRVLSVGCGFGLEALGVQQIITNAYYEGIDSDPGILLGGVQFNPQLPPERFREADAIDQASFGEEPWDLIIIRNPQLKGKVVNDSHWGKVIANSINATKEGGFLYMTTLSEWEYRRLIEYLKLFPQLRIEDLPEEIPLELPKIPYAEHFAVLVKKLAPSA